MDTRLPLVAACALALASMSVTGVATGQTAQSSSPPHAPAAITSSSVPVTSGDDSTLNGQWPSSATQSTSSASYSNGGSATYTFPPHGPPPPPPPPVCGVPPPSTRDVSGTIPCPSGQVGSHDVVYHQVADWSCPSQYGSPVEGPWTTTSTTDVSNTCAALCVAPPPSYRDVDYNAGCPAGWAGQNVLDAHQVATWSCPTQTGSPVEGGWATYSTTEVSNTCVAPCSAPAPSYRNVNGTEACPAGQIGVKYVVYHQEATWYCPSQYGNPAQRAWTTYSTTVTSSTCHVPPPPPPPKCTPGHRCRIQ